MADLSAETHGRTKYIVILFLELIVVGAGIPTTLFIYSDFGFVFAIFSLAFFGGIFTLILTTFANKGYREYSYEEAIAAQAGGSKVMMVRVQSPDTGQVHFNERGYMVPTQTGCFFFYGWPNIFGHKLLVVNNLTMKQLSGALVVIKGAAPKTFNDMKWIDTETPISIKGKDMDYLDLKAYGAAVSLAQRHGDLARSIMAYSPNISKNAGQSVPLSELMEGGST